MSQENVREFLKEFEHANVIKANIISDDLPSNIERISLCNIDVDLYEAVSCSLQKVAPLITQGGAIILEDQGHTPALGGAYLAMAEFLESPLADAFTPVHLASGQMLLIKVRSGREGIAVTTIAPSTFVSLNK